MAAKKDEYKLYEVLKKVFGFDSFKGNQEAIINNVLHDKDTFVIMPTGGGKSLMLPTSCTHKGGNGNYHFPPDCPDEKPGGFDPELRNGTNVAHFMNSSLTKQEIAQVKAGYRFRRYEVALCCSGNNHQRGKY
jgi:ATP-dependent DNA helicase RecQ